MATATTVTEAYTALVAGPVHVQIQNQSRAPMKWRAATTGAQASNLAGIILHAGKSGIAYVPTGQSLYAKMLEGTGVSGTIVHAQLGANPA